METHGLAYDPIHHATQLRLVSLGKARGCCEDRTSDGVYHQVFYHRIHVAGVTGTALPIVPSAGTVTTASFFMAPTASATGTAFGKTRSPRTRTGESSVLRRSVPGLRH